MTILLIIVHLPIIAIFTINPVVASIAYVIALIFSVSGVRHEANNIAELITFTSIAMFQSLTIMSTIALFWLIL